MKNERTKGLVSVVISNYNNEKFIIQGLDSIVNQSYKNIELIIVDDASTDDSVKLIKEWISKNSDQIMITLIELPRNCGFSGALTTGLYVATGQYIAMQDGDDYSHVKRIERQVNYLESNIDVGSIGCNYAVFSEEYKTPKTIPNNVRSGIEEIREIFSKGESAVCHGTLLFRGEIFDKIGGLNRNMDGAEDYDYITRLLPYGVDNLKQSLYYYRIHEKQRSKQFYGDIDKKREKVDKKEIRVLMVIDIFGWRSLIKLTI